MYHLSLTPFSTSSSTAAGSAVSAVHLTPSTASHVVVLGAGLQAEVHVLALGFIRPIARVTVVNRSIDGAATLAARLTSQLQGKQG